MWVFTSKGFLSIVAFRKTENLLVVRARNRKHLEELFPWADISETRLADYRFRTIMDRDDFGEFMAGQVADIKYENFKDSIKADEWYKFTAGIVWLEMKRYQEEGTNYGRKHKSGTVEFQQTKGRRSPGINRRPSAFD